MVKIINKYYVDNEVIVLQKAMFNIESNILKIYINVKHLILIQ